MVEEGIVSTSLGTDGCELATPALWETDVHALIIEPQPLIQLMLEDELRQLGFTSFDSAATQDGAVAAAQRHCPDLITASIRLMGGCGIETVKVICSSRAIPTIYIVSNPEEAREAAGDNIFITKPVSKDDLREAVERVIQKMEVRSSQAA